MRLCAIAGHCALMRCTVAPYPNPLPEGEGEGPDLLRRPEIPSRTQASKPPEIGSLSPLPLGGGPTFREGWGEGDRS